jgi:hypothetical protein
MKRKIFLIVILTGLAGSNIIAQTVSFNFSLSTQTVSGWINVHGDPSTGVRSATDGTTGIGVSSIATANWVPISGTGAAYDGLGASGGTYFPSGVMLNHWFQYSTLAEYNAAVPQLVITGLNKDSVYTIKMAGSSTSSYNSNPTQYSVEGTTVYGYINVNNHNNTANGASFNNISPDANGKIWVFVNTTPSTEIADISGIQIIRGHTNPGPVVSVTSPANHAVLQEDGNFGITATATESGGSITKVEFFIDTSKIGEATSSPYSVTWINPDAGSYVITASAVDGSGVSNSTSILVSIEPFGGFWSTTGNIGMHPDSFFIGNVDSLRLGLRTNNVERMSISPVGYVGIGIDTPKTNLQVNGYMSSTTGLNVGGNAWSANVPQNGFNMKFESGQYGVFSMTSGAGFGYKFRTNGIERMRITDTNVMMLNTNVLIGTTTDYGYALAVNGTAIFTKVKVKTAGTWPDYVFKRGYNLWDLETLERYVTLHKHLPGLAPDEQVYREGIDIGEQQATLLKKIEELTLYLIDENKRLRTQNEQLKLQDQELGRQQREIDELKKLIQAKK